MRCGVGTRFGSATRNSEIVPFAVLITGTNSLDSFGDASNRVALVVGPSTVGVDGTVVKVVVAAESVVAASIFTPSTSVVTIASENVGIVVAGRSVDTHVLNDGTLVHVFSGSAFSGCKSGATSRVDEALAFSDIPVATRSVVASCLVIAVISSAGRGDTLTIRICGSN